jgi:hypothetical protein
MSTREDSVSSPLVFREIPVRSVLSDEKIIYSLLLILTLCFGAALRLRGLLGDFPLFDGGMFYTMIGDVQERGYRLPEVTSYNGAGIPFTYPPFAFYLAAALEDGLGMARTTVMQALPAVASAVTVGGVFLLARGLLPSRWAALAATFAFAVMPETFSWLIVGGGLTRSLGLMFAVLALSQLHRMYTRPERIYVASSTLFVALTVLTHLEMTLFLGLSALVMFAFFGRTRRGLGLSLIVFVAALALTAPWWGTVVMREGVAPWFNTGSSRGVLGVQALKALMRLELTSQSYVDALGLLALLGLIISVARRDFFLPCWILSIALLMPWVFTRFASIPAALLIGYVLVTHLWPWMREGFPGLSLRSPPPAWLAPVFVGVLIVSAAASGIQGNQAVLVSVSDESRAAMRWVTRNSDPEDRFLVVTGRSWYHDHIAEWFPTLTQRHSVATVQGLEWLGEFDARVELHRNLKDCATKDEFCIEQWESSAQTGFTYVYISRETAPEFDADECCLALIQSLLRSDGYRIVYQNSAATILTRNPPPVDEAPFATN